MNTSHLRIRNRRLSPVEAELLLSINVDDSRSVSGRVVGPRCRYASTVEVSYRLMPLPTPGEFRVVIPEPSLWTPETPFLYQVSLRCVDDTIAVRHGVCALEMRPQGCKLNGRPFRFEGIRTRRAAEADLCVLRQEGYNAILVTANEFDSDLFAEIGVFAFVEIDAPNGLHSATALAGWIIGQDRLPSFVSNPPTPGDGPVGVRLNHVPGEPLPEWIEFVVVTAELLSQCEQIPQPKLIIAAEGQAPAMGVLGVIADAASSKT